ncbi:MAG: PAS domain-containing protein [Desulfobacteraceae bacterium]|nr:PAS domain-containing protein [Desulfobacteraceae bacterium]
MKSNLKVKLHFHDRVGIVADVSALIAKKGVNIVLMEVERKHNIADVYLEAENGGHSPDWGEIFELLKTIPDLTEIGFIETMPQENRENRFRIVLDNVSDGVISIDKDGRITTINRVAREMLNCEYDDVTGRNIKEINLPDYAISTRSKVFVYFGN